ncbi:MAG: prolyl oligopeptidase family serine peptidase [Trebonia sp.]|jgi:dipeptidyl aminopeptidase/acylaminoacyl peptidase
MTEIAAYGTWKSPISAADVARGAVSVAFPAIAGAEVWWQESRPAEGGRVTIMASAGPSHEPRALLPAPWNARTRVHEYGGRSYLPVPSAEPGRFDLVFANFADQRLYRLPAAGGAGQTPLPLTPGGAGFRFADLVLSPDGREIWCVRETARPDDGQPETGFHVGGGMKVSRAIVAVPLDGSAAGDTAGDGPAADAAGVIRTLVSGAQFFAFPTPSPDGGKLAWINWDHPRMPWDGTELRVGAAAGGVTVADSALVIGGPSESVLAPRWRNDESLYLISDRSGWWNLYEAAAVGGALPRPLHPAEEEFAAPLWQLGGRPFELLSDGRLAVLHGLGELHLAVLDPATGSLEDVDLPGYRTADAELAVSGTTIAAVAVGPRTPWSVLRVQAGPPGRPGREPEIITRQPVFAPDPAYLPDARPVQLSSGGNARVVHALVYAPANPGVTGPAGELPPFIVHVHGGPTSNSVPMLSMEKAFFTSRGIGIIDVNYGGSSGYGRAYRDRLRGEWGVVDVADAMNAALALAAAGQADRARLGIRGGSAGGWTALAAVTSGPALTGIGQPVFAAATSYFGISDLRPLVTDTHDFESRYLDGLIGPLPGADAVYAERAPVGHVSPLTCPVLLLQGLDDPIVPPAQSEAIAADLAAYGIPHAYLAFEGESHGFRKAETLIASLEAELAFYGQIFGFTPPGVPPIKLS